MGHPYRRARRPRSPASRSEGARIVIDEVKPLADAESGGVATEQIAGRAFGELDATAPANPLINDVLLGRDPDGKLRNVATFVITRHKNPARASGLMWHEEDDNASASLLTPSRFPSRSWLLQVG